MKNSGHEQESGQRRVRRNEGAGKHQPDSDRSKATGRTSSDAKSQPQRINRATGTGIGELQSRGEIAGGILRQLIARADSQLAKIDDRITQLEVDRRSLQQEREAATQERAQLQRLLEDLQQTIQEDT